VFLSSFGERFPSESSDDGIFCQFMRVFENNATSSSLQTFDLFLVLMTTATPCDVTYSRSGKIMDLYKRLPDSVVNRGLTFERQPSFWDTLAVCNGLAGPCKSIIIGQCNGLAGYSLYLKYNSVSVYQTCPLSLSNWSQNYASIN